MKNINRILLDQLENYNIEYSKLELILFNDAIYHICRITRTL